VHPHTIDEPTVPPVQFTVGHKLVESIFQTHLFGSIDYSIILSNPPPHGGELSETTHQNNLMAKCECFLELGWLRMYSFRVALLNPNAVDSSMTKNELYLSFSYACELARRRTLPLTDY